VRVLVTGAAGFLGSNLAKKLAEDGHSVVAADSLLSGDFTNLIRFPGDCLTLSRPDDIDSMIALGPFDIIFHQASITGVVGPNGEDQSDPHRMMYNNVETFRRLLDWAVATKARVIWASSCSIYGRGPVPMKESQPPDPLNVYAFSKLAMERMAFRYAPGLAHPIVGLRYSNVYGPGEDHKGRLASMIHQLAKQMRAGKRPRIFTAGEQKRDFVYIDDAVQANLKAITAKTSGNFNAGAGRSWSFNQVVAELNRVLKTNLSPDYFDNPYSFTQNWTETDQTLAREVLGYEPQYDLAKGIDAYHSSGKLGISV
jgi:ADP-L-glycero-D-manno-heptose 6-epimerase